MAPVRAFAGAETLDMRKDSNSESAPSVHIRRTNRFGFASHSFQSLKILDGNPWNKTADFLRYDCQSSVFFGA